MALLGNHPRDDERRELNSTVETHGRHLADMTSIDWVARGVMGVVKDQG